MNSVNLMGRLAAAPELRQTASGVSVTSFSLAVDRIGKDNGAMFLDCVAFRGTAEFISKYFDKGNRIAITGHLDSSNYEDKNGNKRKRTNIICDSVEFCERKQAPSYQAPAAAPSYQAPSIQPAGEEFAEIRDDEDLPF